jgi:hypothetical protein
VLEMIGSERGTPIKTKTYYYSIRYIYLNNQDTAKYTVNFYGWVRRPSPWNGVQRTGSVNFPTRWTLSPHDS